MVKMQKGFTLIELMIVVAIIGILAAIAIPNFLRFQAKSKQAEAKTNLGAIGTTAEAFRAEYDTYNTAFSYLGWKEQGSCRYGYHWNGALTDCSAHPTGWVTCPSTQTTAATNIGFTASAGGNIDKDAVCDMWNYNDVRKLDNPINDVSS